MRWLPEFALKHSELEGFNHASGVEMMEQAAKNIFSTDKYSKRGEFGELLLHVAIRQCFDTVPAISKIFYKDGPNETVKGFDAVHVVASPDSLELWLGEVKFYKDIARAIRDVVKELEAHTKRDYLRTEFGAIVRKIDDTWPHAEKLKKLLHENTSLDEIFTCACIPVLLTYDSPCISAFDAVSEDFKNRFSEEVNEHHLTFAGKNLPSHIKIHLFLLPLKSKVELVKKLQKRLKAWQSI